MQKSFICLLQTYINEEKFSSFQNVMMLRIESKINTRSIVFTLKLINTL